jgi:hypothetical protein
MITESLIDQAVNQHRGWNDYASALSAQECGTPYELQLLHNLITDYLFAVPSVETVFVDRSRGIVRVWAIVDDLPEEVFEEVQPSGFAISNKNMV